MVCSADGRGTVPVGTIGIKAGIVGPDSEGVAAIVETLNGDRMLHVGHRDIDVLHIFQGMSRTAADIARIDCVGGTT